MRHRRRRGLNKKVRPLRPSSPSLQSLNALKQRQHCLPLPLSHSFQRTQRQATSSSSAGSSLLCPITDTPALETGPPSENQPRAGARGARARRNAKTSSTLTSSATPCGPFSEGERRARDLPKPHPSLFSHPKASPAASPSIKPWSRAFSLDWPASVGTSALCSFNPRASTSATHAHRRKGLSSSDVHAEAAHAARRASLRTRPRAAARRWPRSSSA